MPSMTEIETRARKFAEARDKLRDLCAALNEGVNALQKDHLPGIRRAVQRASEAEADLKALIEQSPELFQKPKTVTLHGVRLGYMKGKGGIEWADGDAVVAAIMKYLPEQAENLIRWTGKPLKAAINQLDVASLKKIGCRVVDTGEIVFIKPVDSAVDKMVDALLKGAAEEVAA